MQGSHDVVWRGHERKKRLKGNNERRNLLFVAKELKRMPIELEKVGSEHRRVHVSSRLPVLGWLLKKLDIIIEDISAKIPAKEYDEMLAEIIFEKEEEAEAYRKANDEAKIRRR